MARYLLLSLAAVFALSACVQPQPMRMGAEGRPVPAVYRLSPGDLPRVQFRMLDAVNSLRQNQGLAPLQLNPQLNAAAQTHARDMSVQNRPWHFGSDGSSPIDRARRAGYGGTLLGEAISETFETELETLTAWMTQRDTRNVILEPSARDLGFAYYQESNGKLWWTLVTGAPAAGGSAGRFPGS